MLMSKILSKFLYDFLNVVKVLKVVVLPITEIDINRIDEIGENFGISKREMQEIVEKFELNDFKKGTHL